jgi:DNA-binding transcriptional regulator GbsR (MarR family)
MPEQSSIEAARLLFIRRWGEMAASWGISRTMAEIHALLYVAPDPLCTDDVMEQLSVSRGSASTNLRQLVNWGLIHRSHRRNDRKEYFEAEKDVWQMFETIVRERRRREVQPIVETLQRCLEMIEQSPKRGAPESNGDVDAFKRRIGNMLEFCEMMNTLFNVVSKGGQAGFAPFTKSLAKLVG